MTAPATAPAAGVAAFQCPRCGNRSTAYAAFCFAKVGRRSSNVECQACHTRTRLSNVSYPMVCVAIGS